MDGDGLLTRAGELKEDLVAFGRQPRFAEELQQMLNGHGGLAGLDDYRLTLLFDRYLLEHRLGSGRRLVEEYVISHPELPREERDLLLSWRDVVEQPFEVDGVDGQALVVVGLIDELSYRVRSNMGPAVFDQVPARSFLLARLVPFGAGEWLLSGPIQVIDEASADVAYQVALQLATMSPQVAFRNPDKLAQAWELQRLDRDRFIRFFGKDLVVVPGSEAQERLDAFWRFRHEEALKKIAASDQEPAARPPTMALPPDLTGATTVGLIYDEVDGLGFYAELGLVEAAFADPEQALDEQASSVINSYLRDPSVEPTVIRRLAERDRANATELLRRLLDWPSFDWDDDGEALLRQHKAAYFEQPPQPKVNPLTPKLSAAARAAQTTE